MAILLSVYSTPLPYSPLLEVQKFGIPNGFDFYEILNNPFAF
jgi:hypothetical protein